jgi:hypothetical protein
MGTGCRTVVGSGETKSYREIISFPAGMSRVARSCNGPEYRNARKSTSDPNPSRSEKSIGLTQMIFALIIFLGSKKAPLKAELYKAITVGGRSSLNRDEGVTVLQ